MTRGRIGLGALVALVVAGSAQTAPAPRSGQIAFTRYRLQDAPLWSEIFVARPDGTGVHKVSHSSSAVEDDGANWSPDGRLIAFTRCKANSPCSIWTVRADGSGQHHARIACRAARTCDDSSASFTPDGRHLVFTHAWGRVKKLASGDEIEHSAIATSDLDGGRLRILRRLPAFTGDLQAVRVSPDGGWLVYDRFNSSLARPVGADALFILKVGGGRPRQLTPWRLSAGSPSWSPDGKRVLFKRFVQGTGELTPGTNLYTIGRDGSDLRQVTHVDRSHYVLGGSFSPDGRSIVFATDEGATPNPRGGTFADVVTEQIGSDTRLRVTRSANLDGWPSWGAASGSG